MHRGKYAGEKWLRCVASAVCEGPSSFCKWKRPFTCISFDLWIGFLKYVWSLNCKLYPDSTLHWNQNYHLMHKGLKPAFIKHLWFWLDLLSNVFWLKTHMTIFISLQKDTIHLFVGFLVIQLKLLWNLIYCKCLTAFFFFFFLNA